MKRTPVSSARAAAAAGLALGLCGLLPAADFPAAVDGVLTLDLALGVTNTYASPLPAAATLVKTGPGCAILGAASTLFAGSVDVREGTLTLADRAAVGANTKIAVTGDAATLHLNFPRPAGAGQGTVLFAGHDVTIRGRGVDGRGAFRYTAPVSGLDDSMLESLTLSGDAAIAVPSRFGIQKALVLNGHTLTRVEGTAQWMWYNAGCTVDAGIVSNLVGTLTMQNGPRFTAPDETTFAVTNSTLDFWAATPPLACRVVLGGAKVTTGSGTDPKHNIISGPLEAIGWLSFKNNNNTAASQRLELRGPFTAASGLTQNGPGALHLDGPTAVAGRTYLSGGRIVCSSNVTRTVADGLVMNGTNTRLDLGDGTLSCDWFRLANGGGGVRCALRQTGGAFTVRGDAYVGESAASYGAYLMAGGTATFSNHVHICRASGSEGLVWQDGGTLRLRNWGTTIFVGDAGRGFLGVFAGATNDTRAVRTGAETRLHLGSGTNGVATLAVSGAGAVVTTEALKMGMEGRAATNVVAVTDGGTLKARRFFRAQDVAAGARNDVYVDGGTIMPTFWTGWNHVGSSEANFFARSPDRWTIGPRGMVVDTSEMEGDKEGDVVRLPVDWPHALSDAEGRGLASVALPTDDDAFAAEVYRGPVFVDIEGPEGSHGAAAVAAFDAEKKALTHVVVLSPGGGYDETTRVYVRAPGATGRYACTYALTGPRAGGRLVKRGAYTLNLHGTNTYTGGTVVEGGKLALKGVQAFPANTALKVMDGAVLDGGGRALAVSALGGAGGTVTNCLGVSVGEALEIAAAELFAASGPLTVEAAVAFAAGVKVRVADPENLAAHRHAPSVPFLAARDGFTGAVPRLDLADATGTRWTVYASGNVLRVGPVNGTLLILR